MINFYARMCCLHFNKLQLCKGTLQGDKHERAYKAYRFMYKAVKCA